MCRILVLIVRTYHQGIIISLLNGWSPVYGKSPDAESLWVNHYSKAFEFSQTMIVSFTGFLESGKYWFLLHFVLYILFYYFIKVKLFTDISN
ncbi:hypothetical protein NMU02_03845 [Coprobacter sp. LH1063]|uniref:Uncharacterized protein n=1 Tax=Coprobacter tertius TaxID=2944915 RepID=A0ABT1MF10_9BACT|nr:hypothetical protein [Coprobacter tertius]